MKNLRLLNTAFIVSFVLFNFFFWQEDLGLNLTIFSFLLITLLFVSYQKAFDSLNVKITLAGTIITSVMVLVFNSTESKIAQIVSFMLMVAFIHENGLRSLIYAGMHMMSSLIVVPRTFFRRKNESLKKMPRVYSIFRIMRLSIFPISIAFIFYMLYCFANPIFGSYAEKAMDKFFSLVNSFFESISILRILFVIFGAVILAVIFYKNETKIFLQRDLSFSEKLERIRKSRKMNVNQFSVSSQPVSSSYSEPLFKSIALKNQNRRGVILLMMVNLLLLVENIIDVKWLWFGFTLPASFSLQHYVHEGTGFLIASILFSMGVLIYYFRRNQNFYPKNKLLKSLAYLWILQNMILCVSVMLRNYHYIDFHGLAYRRIGVVIFLLLTIYGLVTFYFKIRNVKSVYYLLRMNTWALYISLVLLSCYNWDVKIAEYNLAHWNKGEIDVDFYLKLSEKAMPVIFENLGNVKEQIEAHKNNRIHWITYLDYDVFVRDLRQRRDHFIEKYERHSWLSFNFQDERAYQELSKKELTSNFNE